MKIKLKKRVLFNFIKQHITENRTFDNPSGNFVSPLNKEAPIKPIAHMATQLTVEQPPVEDPDYIPATVQELAAAAGVISREVPENQIDFFYRKLHALLDDSLDQSYGNFLNEGINLLSEAETMRDKWRKNSHLSLFLHSKLVKNLKLLGENQTQLLHLGRVMLFVE
jgi:hypothetical protein